MCISAVEYLLTTAQYVPPILTTTFSSSLHVATRDMRQTVWGVWIAHGWLTPVVYPTTGWASGVLVPFELGFFRFVLVLRQWSVLVAWLGVVDPWTAYIQRPE